MATWVGIYDLGFGHLAANASIRHLGKVCAAMGKMASANPWRFSTKYYDTETGLLDFGFRYYSPSLRPIP